MKILEFALQHGLKKKTVEYHVSRIKADSALVVYDDGEYDITNKGVKVLEERLNKLIATNSVVNWKEACEARDEELQSLRSENERLKLENESLKTYVSIHPLSERFIHTVEEYLNTDTKKEEILDTPETVKRKRGRPRKEIKNEKDS